ncbi:adenylosuccinate lyase [Candidatus Woesebacteria bacterium CG_4_10_14_0_2_um_filter_39_14]|uniref:Adenylosuccinate lyase n=2 Tax=Microgenomates group TaxID=1794810 RepID=A0A2M8GGT2_9BACT|nr:MAG: adenylosuccinate lyase [Candidatus Woesebacteria bacterium CG_4_10_14_0_2_um_filter_39_14]PJC76625.1 MAG: adenylosuccinate lyase [Candidatus Shapirobacteria bacterium CG_4_8_14_3_um_filter_39_11]
MTNDLNQLTAISPIDGRYFLQTCTLTNYFSEFALFKYRVEIELRYLIFLSKEKITGKITQKEEKQIMEIYERFSLKDAQKIKDFEKETKHDVKAVEYFIRHKFTQTSLSNLGNWIHFGLTSNDINDNVYRLMIKDALGEIIVPEINRLVITLQSIAKKYIKLPMLGRTHGQPAIPTTFGKEMAVFSTRIEKELRNLKNTKLYGKFGGAVGNWNALHFAFPEKNWINLSEKFLKSLDLKQSMVTTQIAPTEDLVSLFQNLFRVNSILLDFNQDMWRYISDEWLVQKGKTEFVGSSTMPQKINPIEFENSEGNLVIANGLFETFSRKLPISRLQRDLSDSTVLRNIGVAFGHSLIAYKSCLKGLESISPNNGKILSDLNEDWSILSEALQTILRKEGKTDAYESVAIQIRGKKMDKKSWLKLIVSLDISKPSKNKLKNLTPEDYLGMISKF